MNEARAALTLDNLDLAALIASRVCHDVINPVGAIVNGLELLDDDPDPSTRDMAIDMIRKSAASASARLQFCRIAFGAAGSAGAAVDTRDAHKVAASFINDDRTSLDWLILPAILPKNRVKLLLNLILIATGAILRGGQIRVEAIGEGDETGFKITVTGTNVRVPPHAAELLAGVPTNDSGTIDAHSIQPYFAGLLARASGMTVTLTHLGEAVEIRAT